MNSKNRKTKKMDKKNKEDKYFYISLGLLILGILSLISLFSPKMGLVGLVFHKTFSFLAGSGNFLFPLLLIFWGLIFNIKSSRENLKIYTICLFIIILCILVFLDGNKTSDLTLVDRISLSIEYKDIATSGGVIGALLGFFLYKLFGSLGTYAIMFIIIFLNLYILYKYNFIGLKVRTIKFSLLEKIKKRKENADKKVVKPKEIRKKPMQDINYKDTDLVSDFQTNSEKNILIRDYNNNNTDEEYENKSSQVQDLMSDSQEKNEQAHTDKENNLSKDKVKEQKVEEITQENNKDFEQDLKKEETKEAKYVFPPIELLESINSKASLSNQEIMKNGQIIEKTMQNFGIDSKIIAINKGPVITCYEIQPAPGVKLSKIVALNDNLAMSLASSDIRIEAPIPGKSAVGIEVPNRTKDSVTVREIVESKEFKKIDSLIPLSLGKDVSGNIIISSIDKMPHLMIAGATGSGKSVCINTIITSIIYKCKPEEVKLLLIDPKVVELSIYNGIPHLLTDVVTDPKKAAFALNWAVGKMEKRYKLFAENSVRDISSYNKKMKKIGKLEDILPKIVIIVDELADLMMVAQKEVEEYIARLAQMARAAGIHLILATQRPSVDVITGTIKANIPSRIAFSVSSSIDSRTILDMAGAEKLLGKGDMLFYPSFYSKPVRIQGSFISDEEVENIVNFVKANSIVRENTSEDIQKEIEAKTKKLDDEKDPLFEEALKYVLLDEQASISFLQRKLKIGYSRAARIVDQMEEVGILGSREGSKPRKLLVGEEEIKNILGEKDE